MTQGVVYIASGSSYIQKAKMSAESVKKHHPDINITIFTDCGVGDPVFDSVKQINRNIIEKGDSVLNEKHMMYDKNLYLDADTHVCGSVAGLFDILDRHDIAAAHNEGRSWYHQSVYDNIGCDIPSTFPEYNTGVIPYRNTNDVVALFERWNELYDSIGYGRNQPAFRIALHESDVNLGTLPPEYNFMTNNVGFISGGVKILHQGPSDEDLTEWEAVINSVPGKKVITWEKVPCRVVPDRYEGRRYKLKTTTLTDLPALVKKAKQKYEREGMRSVISATGRRMKSFIFGT